MAEKHRVEAAKLIAERRPSDLANLKVASTIPGVYAWAPGAPRAGVIDRGY